MHFTAKWQTIRVWNVFACFGGVPGVNDNQTQMCLSEWVSVCVCMHKEYINNQQIIFLRGLSMQIEYLLDWGKDQNLNWIELNCWNRKENMNK